MTRCRGRGLRGAIAVPPRFCPLPPCRQGITAPRCSMSRAARGSVPDRGAKRPALDALVPARRLFVRFANEGAAFSPRSPLELQANGQPALVNPHESRSSAHRKVEWPVFATRNASFAMMSAIVAGSLRGLRCRAGSRRRDEDVHPGECLQAGRRYRSRSDALCGRPQVYPSPILTLAMYSGR